jgi:DnaJ-class molecular chaperone
MAENYYTILGINENASSEEIKKAYRSLQMKWHPDKNAGSQESINMTQKLNEAYETLGDEQKKEEYDFNRKNPNPFAKMSGAAAGGGVHHVNVNDLFSSIFGGGMPFGMGGINMGGMGGMGGMQGFPAGANIHIFHGGFPFQKPEPVIKQIELSLEQVLTGLSLPIEIERWIMENGNKVFEKETMYVPLPAGIDEGEMVILPEKGNVLNGNIKGDIKIQIKINNTTEFKRSGLDLILEKTISLKEALCGFSFEIKYINGKSYTLNNNKGNIIPSGYKKVYPEMGLVRDGRKGNMIIHFNVQFPEKLTEEQIDKISGVL